MARMSMPVLESALVQILFRGESGEHRPVGAGFLVTARHIFTCAHVVNNSLGLQPVCAEQPIIPIWLDFPLLLPRSSHAPLKAKVKVWHPMHSSPQRDKFEDIAVLELMEEVVLPREAGSAPLVKVDRFFDRPVRMVGFPGKKDEVDWLSGTLQSHVENGRVQIDTREHSRSVRAGFSGAPVWESGEDAVAGMIVAADTGTGILSAYMIPTAILRDACPDLSLPAREPCERAPEPFLHLRDRFTHILYFPSWKTCKKGGSTSILITTSRSNSTWQNSATASSSGALAAAKPRWRTAWGSVLRAKTPSAGYFTPTQRRAPLQHGWMRCAPTIALNICSS